MSGERYDAVASGDRARDGADGRAVSDDRNYTRNANGDGGERGRAGPGPERWHDSPYCTEHERRERWPVG